MNVTQRCDLAISDTGRAALQVGSLAAAGALAEAAEGNRASSGGSAAPADPVDRMAEALARAAEGRQQTDLQAAQPAAASPAGPIVVG
jgi:hypothetical protein